MANHRQGDTGSPAQEDADRGKVCFPSSMRKLEAWGAEWSVNSAQGLLFVHQWEQIKWLLWAEMTWNSAPMSSPHLMSDNGIFREMFSSFNDFPSSVSKVMQSIKPVDKPFCQLHFRKSRVPGVLPESGGPGNSSHQVSPRRGLPWWAGLTAGSGEPLLSAPCRHRPFLQPPVCSDTCAANPPQR